MEKEIDKHKEALRTLSAEIWRNPELKYEEHSAHRVLTEFLEKRGFLVEKGYAGIATAFRARFGSGEPNVCVICEYDALPEIGHGCGHNLIAEAGVAAGLGTKAWLEVSGTGGTLTVMGTPAEEGGSGKDRLIEAGGFRNIDVAMMAHPAPFECAITQTNAIVTVMVEFEGKAAHAAAYPWDGVNALDAAVLAYNNISALRQQMKPSWRVHGVIANGGVEPAIIPEKSLMKYYVRAPNKEEVLLLKQKVIACFVAAGCATDCKVNVRIVAENLEIVSNTVLAKIYAKHVEALGVAQCKFEYRAGWSTDMGSVSHVVPAIHPSFAIGSGKEVNHTREFTRISNTPEAHEKTITVAKAMALTCIDVFSGGKDLLQKIKKEFASVVT